MDNAALFAALRAGHLDLVHPYFEANPEHIDVRNLQASDTNDQWDEISPIHTAAKHGHLELVKLLVDKGATVYSHPAASYPAVMLAAWSKHTDVVDYFLKEIPGRAAGTHGLGITCNLAGRQGWIELVRAHIARDPLAVHQRGWIGDTPLHWPAHNGYLEIVRLLLDSGADPNAEESNWIGGTPLHWASERNPAIIRLLVAYGADPNARVTRPGSDHLGATPLIWCAKQQDDCAEAAVALLECGADPQIEDAAGKRAVDYARPNIKEVLQKG